jgi:hypothetical protein
MARSAVGLICVVLGAKRRAVARQALAPVIDVALASAGQIVRVMAVRERERSTDSIGTEIETP